ncbi:MAG: site-2 protease family protein [Patescibacteria group bacterium]|nr:site-2 protease family protein [Patescibacteria group bacterium]
MFFGGGIKLIRIFGIDIYIDYSWFVIFFLVTWSLAMGVFPVAFPQLGLTTNFILGVITSVLFFISALGHEIAHSLVARANGVSINKITLFLFGGAAQLTDEPPSAKAEFKMAIAGPLSSLVIASFFEALSFLGFYRHLGLPFVAVTSTLAVINFWLGIFNLFPGYPLDGGRVFRAIIWYFIKDLRKATRYASFGGHILALLLIFFGVFEISLNNLIGGIWAILIGFFLSQAAESSYQQVKFREDLGETQVKELMTEEAASVSPETTIKKLVDDYFLKLKTDELPVVENGEILGVVSASVVEDVPEKEWPKLKVTDVMKKEIVDVLPTDKASLALKKISGSGKERLPVVKGKKFLGFISLGDIEYYLALKKRKRLG